ncbi:MAG: electron transport complex protein RnfG [Verrucomicrobiales bacterium]
MPVITRKRAEALSTAVLKVLPGATTKRAFMVEDGQLRPAGVSAAEEIYAAYDQGGTLVGIAIPAEGMGYQDTIRSIYGYDPEHERIIGFHVLESRETPGLGDRIGIDPGFLKNFAALDASLAANGNTLHAITAVKRGEKSEAWEIDGISGATVSSVAVANLLQTSAAKWMPLIQQNRNILRAKEVPHAKP